MMSTKLTTWVLAGAVLVCHYGSLMAETRPGEPSSAMASSFDGAASEWDNSERPNASDYITTPHGRGFTIRDGVHPYKGYDIGESFSLALYADISAVAVNGTKRLLLVAGQANYNHVALLKTAANTVAVYQGKAQLGELTFDSEALASGYHLFVFGGNSTESFLAVDGVKVASSTTTGVNNPTNGLQVGSIFGGYDNNTNRWTGVDKGIGMKVDEVRHYDHMLSDDEIAKLGSTFMDYRRETAIRVRDDSTVAMTLSTEELAKGQVTFTSANTTEPTGVTWKLSHAGTALSVTPTATFVPDGQSGTWTVSFTANTAYEAITLDEDVRGPGIPAAAKTVQPNATMAFGKRNDYLAISADGTYWPEAIKVTGVSGSPSPLPMIFGGLGYAENGPINRDILLTVTGGDFSHIYGGNNADDWGNNRARNINGNTRVEMSGGTVNYLLGGNYKDGYAKPVTLGDIDVVVSGTAVVKGSIFGGSVSAHIQGTDVGSPTQPQKVTVKVKNLQKKNSAESVEALRPGYIAGGDTYMRNTSPTSNIYGDTAVVIDLPAEATGDFVKSLVGGSALLEGGGMRSYPQLKVNGNSSVTIDAPNTVTFSQTVMGGPVFGGTTGSAVTTGNASVTIRGGKYTGTIYAGGSGASASVTGDATLTLEGGDFSAATIAPCGNGSSVGGTSTLAIAGDVDLSTTTLSDFSTFSVAEGKTLTLGTKRLKGTTLTAGASPDRATLAVTLTEAEVTAGYAELCGYSGETLPRVSVTLPDAAWSTKVIGGKLVLSTASKEVRWSKGAANWSDGLTGFNPGDYVTFGKTTGSEAEGVAVPSGIAAGEMTVNGAYTFTLEDFGAGFSASKITVSSSGKATFESKAVRYVRLQLDNANGGTDNNSVPGVSELILTKGGTAVAWPRGTTIKQDNPNGPDTDPTWAPEGNEKVNALIDGVWNGSGNDRNYTNPFDNSTGTYTGNSGNNKWWPYDNRNAYAVIELGDAVDFDGYKLMTTDHSPRSAKNWTLEVSADGETWFLADSRTNWPVPDNNSFYTYKGGTIFPVDNTVVSAPIVVESNGTLGGSAKITGDVTFAMGAYLDATTEQPLEITGAVTATGTEAYPGVILVNLPPNAVVWPVLKTTTEGLAANLSHLGYEFHYREGTYWAVRTAAKTVTAEVTEAGALSNLTWTQDADKSKVVAPADLLKLWDFALNNLSATLNTTTAAAVTIDCATVPALTLSGSAAVTLSAANEVTPTIASLTVAADSTVAADLLNCVTGAVTVNEGKTLSLSGTGVSLTKLPTGTGSVKIPVGSSVTYTNGENAYSGWTTVAGELTLACELGFTEATGANPTYPIDIAQGGKVKLATGGSTHRSFQGEGDIEVTENATLGIPTAASVEGGFSLTGTITVNADVTLTIAAWVADVSALSGANLCVKGTIAKSNSEYSTVPTVTIANGKTLSGTGTINVPVAFENGSVIKTVANGAVTCSDTVTLPETGTVTVQAKAYGAAVLKKSGLDVTKFALPTGEAGWQTDGLFTEKKDGTLLLVAKPTFTPPADTPAMSEETARVIAKLAADSENYGVTTVEVTEGRNPAAVEVFNNVMTVNNDTATISYDFGVSDITVKRVATATANLTAQLYVVVCAKVSNGKTEGKVADYANDTTVSLLLEGAAPTGVVALDDTETLGKFGIEASTGEKWFAVPLENLKKVTNAFTVKATK